MLIINVCIGSACHLKGSYNVVNKLQELIEKKKLEDKVVVKGAFCLGECTKAVSVRIDEGPIMSVSEEAVDNFFEKYVVERL